MAAPAAAFGPPRERPKGATCGGPNSFFNCVGHQHRLPPPRRGGHRASDRRERRAVAAAAADFFTTVRMVVSGIAKFTTVIPYGSSRLPHHCNTLIIRHLQGLYTTVTQAFTSVTYRCNILTYKHLQGLQM